MAREFGGDLFDFENMTDDEIRDVVIEHMREQPNLDVDDIDIVVRGGLVTLSGRVGTDAEVLVAGEVLDDVLGIDNYSNELVVDPARRGDSPVAADDEVASLDSANDELGGVNSQQSDTAEHLVEDLESETRGTHDTGRAIRDATPYEPPDGPVGDGYGSREDH
jgi:hypothetical protein